MNNEIRNLLILQGIKKTERLYRGKCPFCNNRTLIINTKKGFCYICHKEKSLKELIYLAEEDWLQRHRENKNIMEEKKGVK